MGLRLVKIVSASVLLASSALVGDCYNICDRFINPVYYKEVLVADGFYKDPFRLRKEYRVNEEGFLEVYFGDREMHPVSDELRVNERKLGGRVKDETKGLLRRGGEKLGEALDTLQELGHEFYRSVIDED